LSHENYQRIEDPHGASPRHFGWLLAVVAALVAGWALWKGLLLLGVGAGLLAFAMLLIAQLLPIWLGVPLRWWMGLAQLLGRVINPLLLGLIYLLLFVPLALWFRLIRRDALALRLDREVKSYWIERDRSLDLGQRMRRPF
jgi:hypothetical protein